MFDSDVLGLDVLGSLGCLDFVTDIISGTSTEVVALAFFEEGTVRVYK